MRIGEADMHARRLTVKGMKVKQPPLAYRKSACQPGIRCANGGSRRYRIGVTVTVNIGVRATETSIQATSTQTATSKGSPPPGVGCANCALQH